MNFGVTPRTRQVLAHYEIPWRYSDGPLTSRELGSSPGDICWTGSELVMERGLPTWMVFHDVAHHLVAKAKRPGDVRSKNWGLVTGDEEAEAADLGVVLQMCCGLPWRKAALEMSIPDYSMRLAAMRVRGSSRALTEAQWAAVKADCIETAAPYLERFPLPVLWS